jgi:hypothetical protein
MNKWLIAILLGVSSATWQNSNAQFCRTSKNSRRSQEQFDFQLPIGTHAREERARQNFWRKPLCEGSA